MALRNSILLLSCFFLLSGPLTIGAQESEQAAQEEQTETLMDRLDRVLTQEQKQQLNDLMDELRELDTRADFKEIMHKIHDELNEKHGDVMDKIKEQLGTDFIPLTYVLQLGPQSQENAQ